MGPSLLIVQCGSIDPVYPLLGVTLHLQAFEIMVVVLPQKEAEFLDINHVLEQRGYIGAYFAPAKC